MRPAVGPTTAALRTECRHGSAGDEVAQGDLPQAVQHQAGNRLAMGDHAAVEHHWRGGYLSQDQLFGTAVVSQGLLALAGAGRCQQGVDVVR